MTRKQKLILVLRKYGYLMLIGVMALILIIALAVSGKGEESTPTNSGNANINIDNSGTITSNIMTMPVLNATISKSYSNSALQYNATLNQFEAHMGVDFVAEVGSNVYSVLDGQVLEVGSNYLKGNYVVIKHNNGLKSTYSSLGEDVAVSKGDKIKKGDIIGTVGCSAYSELEEGGHLHFELLDNDKKIDPAGYLDLENK